MIRLCILIAAALSLGAPIPAMAQSSGPIVLLVNPKGGVKSVAEFAAWAKRSKKPLAYSSSGPASQRLGEALAQKLEFKTVHIPYRAAQQGILDLIGGHIRLRGRGPRCGGRADPGRPGVGACGRRQTAGPGLSRCADLRGSGLSGAGRGLPRRQSHG
jgi:hypothetical protein